MGRNQPAGPLALAIVLAFLFLTPYAPAPQRLSCDQVAAATSRGGAVLPQELATPGRPSCALGSRDQGVVPVELVIDGDTVAIAGGERVRYIGIDTPELNDSQAYARESKEENARLVGGKKVRLVKDVRERDRFDRLLRYVFVDGVFVNAELVREGYARAMAFPPDTAYAACFDALEAEARRERRGLFQSR